ncbi:MAG: hypothetical protein A4E61_00231 [Syntrophorhabdus sp. PtaB.Bin184]|nr:MAG: hypothetical protein A4E61_00231 [Syntrophorhabdus sp. PtaB.Bin184]
MREMNLEPRRYPQRSMMYSSCPDNEWGTAMAGLRSRSIRFCPSGPKGGCESKKDLSSPMIFRNEVSLLREESSKSSVKGEKAGFMFASQRRSISSSTICRLGVSPVWPLRYSLSVIFLW